MFHQDRYLKYIPAFFIILLAILTTLVFLNTEGTGDIRYWSDWANNADSLGLVSGFKANNDVYPPYASVILLVFLKISLWAGYQVDGAIKLSIIVFLFLTTFIFWVWTRNLTITIILHLSLILNSIGLKYIDIFVAPFLVISLWALKEKKLTTFSVIYTIAFLIKWQPIIIAPFIGLYILNIQNVSQWKQIKLMKLCMSVLFPTLVIICATLSVYGITSVWHALQNALRDWYLSGNALNFNWIITHFLHVVYPEQYGGLIGGQANNIITTSREVTFIPRLLFLVIYIITFMSFFKKDKTFENLILFSLVGYFAYFTFNLSVHENHLIIAAILSIILFWINREHLSTMFILIMISNINLFIFYGIDGTGLSFNRVINGKIDIALLLSFFNVGYFLYLWVMTTLMRKNIQPNIHYLSND